MTKIIIEDIGNSFFALLADEAPDASVKEQMAIASISSLNPRNSFAAFDKKKLIEFSRFYPSEFDEIDDLIPLESTSGFCRRYTYFSNLIGIAELAQKIVEKGKYVTYPLVYLLLKLALTFPVATASWKELFQQ